MIRVADLGGRSVHDHNSDKCSAVGSSSNRGAVAPDWRTKVLSGGSDARYISTGHLVYALRDGLFAVAFDVDQLQVRGRPVSLLEGTMRAANPLVTTASANYGVSDDGTLVYVSGAGAVTPQRTLAWVDRNGQEEPLPVPPRTYFYPRLSPDGTRIAPDIRDEEQDIWIWDVTRRTLTRFTFDPAFDMEPLWTPDGQRLIFTSARNGAGGLYWQAADGTGPVERLTESSGASVGGHAANAITPDGAEIVFRAFASKTAEDLFRLALPRSSSARAERPTPLLQTTFREGNADLQHYVSVALYGTEEARANAKREPWFDRVEKHFAEMVKPQQREQSRPDRRDARVVRTCRSAAGAEARTYPRSPPDARTVGLTSRLRRRPHAGGPPIHP